MRKFRFRSLLILLAALVLIPVFVAAGVRMVKAPEIVRGPRDVTCEKGSKVRFAVSAIATKPEYSWQYSSDNGETWKEWKDKAAPSAVIASAGDKVNGFLYRVTVTNGAGTAVSEPAHLTVTPQTLPTILSQPKDREAEDGKTAVFAVSVKGVGVTYQWEYSINNGESWKSWEGKTERTAHVKASEKNDGVLYRVVVTNDAGSVTSDPAKLTVKK